MFLVWQITDNLQTPPPSNISTIWHIRSCYVATMNCTYIFTNMLHTFVLPGDFKSWESYFICMHIHTYISKLMYLTTVTICKVCNTFCTYMYIQLQYIFYVLHLSILKLGLYMDGLKYLLDTWYCRTNSINAWA